MATILSNNATSAPFGLYQGGASTQEIPLGSKFVDQNGNAYRYCLVGGTALVAGKLYQAPAEVTNHQGLTPAAAAIGATSVTVTLGATAATANQYAEGWLVVTVTPGEGYRYRIAGNAAAEGAATCVITLDDPIQVALTTSSRVDLVLNPYSGVIVNPTTASSAPVGVACDVVAASKYGWLQTGGVAAVLMNGTGVVGTFQCASNAVAGAVEPFTGVQAPVGIAVTGIADTEYGAVKLIFDVG